MVAFLEDGRGYADYVLAPAQSCLSPEFALEQAAEAHRLIEARVQAGKLVLTTD